MSLFISFEGLDHSGKSTQVRRLESALRQHGREVLVLREPGGTPIGEQIRRILLDTASEGLTDSAEVLLFSASRSQLVEQVIRPALRRGVIVICDRFVDSTTAYQGSGRGIDASIIAAVNRAATMGVVPDRTFFLDVPLAELARRATAAGIAKDRIERNGTDFYQRIRSGFLQIAAREDRFTIIDGMQSEDDVAAAIMKSVETLLTQHLNAQH